MGRKKGSLSEAKKAKQRKEKICNEVLKEILKETKPNEPERTATIDDLKFKEKRRGKVTMAHLELIILRKILYDAMSASSKLIKTSNNDII